MIAGVYNLGYVSLAPRPEVDQLLDWWSERLRARLPRRSGLGLLRRPALVRPRARASCQDLAIVRDPQYNVAYWNLHSRRLEQQRTSATRSTASRCAFFHFSGFDPERPLVLSRHQDRIDVAAASGAASGCWPSTRRGDRARATAVSRQWPYGYGGSATERTWTTSCAALYNEYADERDGERAVAVHDRGRGGVRTTGCASRHPAAPPGSAACSRTYMRSAPICARRSPTSMARLDRAAFMSGQQNDGVSEEPLLAKLAAGGPIEATQATPGGDAAAPREAVDATAR